MGKLIEAKEWGNVTHRKTVSHGKFYVQVRDERQFRTALEETIDATNLDLEDPNVEFEQLLVCVILNHVGEMEETEFKKVYRIVNDYFRRVYPELFLLYEKK